MRTGYPSPPSPGHVDSTEAPREADLRHGRSRGRRGPRDAALTDTGQLCETHTVRTVLVKGGSQANQSLGLYGALRGQPRPGPEGPQGDASTRGGPLRQAGPGPTPKARLPQTEGRRGSSARKGQRHRRRRGPDEGSGAGRPARVGSRREGPARNGRRREGLVRLARRRSPRHPEPLR